MTIATGQPMLASDILNLTFFPKGTILTFSSTAWDATSAEFKNIWKICNTANHQADPNVPDLTDRFLRGGASSDFTTGGGADSQDVILKETHLPSHNHGATGLSLGSLSTSGLLIISSGGHTHSGSGSTGATGSGGHTHTVSGTATSTGSAHAHSVSGARPSSSGTGRVLDTVVGYDVDAYSTTTDGTHSHGIEGSTSENGGTHVHDVNISTFDGGGLHSHTVSGSITGGDISGTTANAGSGTAFSVNTVPSYYTVIYIMKVV